MADPNLVRILAAYGRTRMAGLSEADLRMDVLDHAYEKYGHEDDDEDAFWAAIKAEMEVEAPLHRQVRHSGGGEDRGGPPKRTPDKIPDAWDKRTDGVLVTAPFRFTALNDKVSRLDTGETPLNRPLAGHASAVIDVEWRVETPFLIGETKGGDDQTAMPFRLGDRWAIPGATLRGTIRSVVETVAMGRLFQTNRHKRYALRDFEHPVYKDFIERGQREKGMQAGWLRKDGKDGATIEPCDWGFVRIADLIGSEERDDIRKFAQTDRQGKYRHVEQDWTSPKAFTEPRNFETAGENQGKAIYRPGGNKPGYHVFAGRMPGGKVNKKYEYAFFDVPSARPVPLAPHVWETFLTTNCKPSQNKRVPDGAWAELSPVFEKGGRVPVFYVGDLAGNGADAGFSFGLTRLYRIPHKRSVGDVLMETATAHRPGEIVKTDKGERLQLQPDFVEHLFGYVYEPADLAFGHGLGTRTQEYTPPSDVARKGRVAFEFAFPVSDDAFELWPKDGAVETVMGPPRPSFGPFYLAGPEKDYSGEGPRLAGRKRYLARYRPGTGDAPRDPLAEMLKAQIGDKTSADARSRLRFLAPRGDARFKGRIRLHNVSEAELGAILWALTFGGDAEARHLIGRGKAFGAGQVAVEQLTLHVRPNEAWNRPEPPVTYTRGQSEKLRRWLDAFEGEIVRLAGWTKGTRLTDRPEVAGLLQTARPRGWHAPGTAYLPYQEPDEKKQAERFAALRKKTGPGAAKLAAGQAPPDALLPAFGGRQS